MSPAAPALLTPSGRRRNDHFGDRLMTTLDKAPTHATSALFTPGEVPVFHPGFSLRRVFAMVLRYWYLLRSSWPRVLDLIYWPTVQMCMWGLLQIYIGQYGGAAARAGQTFIGAVMLWDVLFRGQLGFSISFLEEMYSRNLPNLLISPLRPVEFLTSLMIMSIVRLAIGMVPVSLLAIAFFGFNLWGLGLALAAFFANLMFTAWAIGIFVAGLLLRNGLGAENMAWSVMFLLLPLTCVYYPVAILPDWLQFVAWSLPPTYVFEGMRALLIEQVFRVDLMVQALAINFALNVVAVVGFFAFLASSRRAGTLLAGGE
jgi:ABC-2 type transport system permease protein